MFAGIVCLCLATPPQVESATPVVSEARKDALARFGAGLWQARRERLLSAIKSLEAAAKQDPDSTAALRELVSAYIRIGREPEAIRTARIVMEKNPKDADTARALANLLGAAGELDEAVAFAKVAAEHVDATEHPEKALAAYRELAALQGRARNAIGAAKAWDLAIELLSTRRKSIVALAALTPHEIDVELANAYEQRGRAHVKAGATAAAASAFQSAHQLYADPRRANDKSAAARLDWNLSAAHAATNPALALKHLEAFLKLRPQSAEPYERLVSLLRATQRDAEIGVMLEGYSGLDPKNEPLRAVLALEQTRDMATRRAGDEEFTRMLAASNDPTIVRLALRSYFETNRAVRALNLLDEAYKALKDGEVKADAAQSFAADKARTVLEILRSEPEWVAAMLRTGSDDLRNGVRRPYQTWYALGVLAARHNKLDIAIEQFQAAVRSAQLGGLGDAYSQLISALRRSRKPNRIVEVCREGLLNTTLFPAYFNSNLALALAELGEANEAIAAADRAITQSGAVDRLGIRLNKVLVLSRLEKWDDAIALCKKLEGEFEDPADRFRIRYLLASSYWGAKKHAEAEAEYRAILDNDPDHAGACNDLGYHLADQGRNLDEAERLVRRAVAVDRADRRRAGDPEADNAAYLDSLAWVLFRKGKLAEARDLLLKTVAIPDGATDGVVWDHLGDVQYRLGEKDKAKTSWRKAERLLASDHRGRRDGRLDDIKRKLARLP